MTGGGIGRIVEIGSGTGGGIGAALRMTTGTVASGRAEALGSGRTLGIGAEVGSGRAVGTETAVGNAGIALGSGSTLATGTASVGTATGTASVGTATGGRGAREGSAGVLGPCGAAVHAADASSPKTTSRRMSNLPTGKRSKSFAIWPRAQRKWAVVAVQDARARLTVWEFSP